MQVDFKFTVNDKVTMSDAAGEIAGRITSLSIGRSGIKQACVRYLDSRCVVQVEWFDEDELEGIAP